VDTFKEKRNERRSRSWCEMIKSTKQSSCPTGEIVAYHKVKRIFLNLKDMEKEERRPRTTSDMRIYWSGYRVNHRLENWVDAAQLTFPVILNNNILTFRLLKNNSDQAAVRLEASSDQNTEDLLIKSVQSSTRALIDSFRDKSKLLIN
jgi:hypothetical protein